MVDALDECQEVQDFVRDLQQMVNDNDLSSDAMIQLLVTSREDLMIKRELLRQGGVHIL